MSRNLDIHKLSYNDIEGKYPDIYKQIFNDENEEQLPTDVYIGFLNGDYVGFMTSYKRNKSSVYIEYAGFVEEFNGYNAVVLFKDVIAFLHKEYKNIICRIKNTNIPALKVALNAGFVIIGMFGVGSEIYIEMIKIDLKE